MLKNKQILPLLTIVMAIMVITVIYFSRSIFAEQFSPIVTDLKNYKLIFNDEFKGDALDTKKWVTCYDWVDLKSQGCSNYGNNELEWYNKSQINLSGGLLSLTAAKANTIGVDKTQNKKTYPYKSGMISTGRDRIDGQAKWTNIYGYYEAKIYNPNGKGIWPAFWLLPEGKKWPPEIDIMEKLGDKPNDILATYFWNDTGTHVAKDSFTFHGGDGFADKWHVYSMNWQKGSLDWYIDGKKIRSITGRYVPEEKMEMVFDLAVGGNLPGNPDNTTLFPATMKIDYVRVYKK